MKFKIATQGLAEEFIKSLVNSKRISGFQTEFYSEDIWIEFQQDLVRPSVQAFEKLSLEYVAGIPMNQQIFPIFSDVLSNITTLKEIKLHFGDQVNYDVFLHDIDFVFKQSKNLQN